MKLYRENEYEKKRIKKKNTFKKVTSLVVGLGMITICFSTIKAINSKAVDNDADQVETTVIETKEEDNSNTKEYYQVGIEDTKNKVIDYLSMPHGNMIYKYSEEFGVDPNLIAAMAMQESSLDHNACIPGGDFYSGYGVGLLQLESPNNQEITAYNYKKGEYETEYITMENACSLEKNIKIGCMIFQNSLENNQGNILMAIQSHNYGQPMLDYILLKNHCDLEQAKSNYQDLKWIDYIKDAHSNPKKYLNDWFEDTYGDGNYIANVLRHMPYKTVKYNYNNKTYKFNLETLKTESVDDIHTYMR